MEYRILGPLEVRREDRAVEVGGHKQRALLALLVLHANEVVPADRLIEELWTGEPPESAAKSLHVNVSRLRKQLGERAVLTRAGGYVLELSGGELDVDRFRAALEHGRQLRAAGDAAAASVTLRQALTLRAGPSADASRRALAHARRAGDQFEQREIVEWLASALLLGPAPAANAAGECERLLAEAAGDPALELSVLGSLAYLVAIQGRTDEAASLIERGREAMHELGQVWMFPVFVALASLWVNDPVAAESELRPGYEHLKKIGETSHLCSVAEVLAQAVYALGRYDEADELVREVARAAGPIEVHSQIVSKATRAKVLARRGKVGEAERLAREAVAFAEESDFLHAHADALIALAEILETSGRPEEAAEATRGAIALHEQKGNVVGIDQARVRLAKLSAT